jgi:hypothetical protein
MKRGGSFMDDRCRVRMEITPPPPTSGTAVWLEARSPSHRTREPAPKSRR